ncbi:MAG: Fe-Mn family superoxide dismutase [Vampirovibrionales bacterium]|nr:Fe-Mn family superoxide dismutase [Vampirovibrionales bacterium]
MSIELRDHAEWLGDKTLALEIPARRSFMKQAGLGLLSVAMAQPLLSAVVHAADHNKPATLSKRPPEAKIPPLSVDATSGAITLKTFEERFARIDGLSSNQLQQHYKLYEGYVKKLNAISAQISALTPEQLGDANGTFHPYRELLVEQTFALNGVVLHELYFSNLGVSQNASKTPSGVLKNMLSKQFGSFETYMAHLMATGKSARGWAITGLNLRDGQIHNYGLDAHHLGMPAYVMPLLVLDVYEHAYLIDFGTNRAAYLDVFTRNLDWGVVEQRLAHVGHHPAFGG